MPACFEKIDHDTPLLLPTDLRDWILAHLLIRFRMAHQLDTEKGKQLCCL